MTELAWTRGLTMRTADGETLVADVWHPREGGPFPTLLVRTAYGREVASAITAPHPSVLARAGYAVVSQDVRGRGDSSGTFTPFVHEAADGAAAVAWAAALDVSNGDVGMYGFSYQGMAQLQAASARPPALRAIAPAMCSADPGEGFLRCGGALRLGFAASWGAQMSGADPFGGANAATALAVRCAHGRVDSCPWWDDWVAGRCGPVVDVSAIDIPALYTVGWYDTFAPGGWRDVARHGGPCAVLGAPWSHIPWSPDRHVATAAHLAFFDEHLARRPGAARTPALRSLACNTTAWRTWHSMPDVAVRTFGLASAVDPSTRFGDGRLVDGPGAGPDAYAVHQPAVPVFTAGGAYTDGAGTLGRQDQRGVQDRTDVLCFVGEPVAADVEVLGAATLVVEVHSDAPTDDVCVTLCEVRADGEILNLAFGASRGKGTHHVVLSPVHAVLPAGSRLSVAIAPSAYPELDLNTSAGAGTQVTRALRLAGSRFTLPVVVSD